MTFKKCSCGRAYTKEQWERLPVLGHTLTDDAEGKYDLELKNCSCGSTMGVERKTHDAKGQPLMGLGKLPLKVTDSPAFQAWFKGSKVVDSRGKPLVVYHGTTADFERFDRSRANPESDFGAGFYFTTSLQDVAKNYAGEGPDLTQKIQLEAERIASETDREYNDPNVVAEARSKFIEHGGAVMPVFLAIKNPFRVGGKGETVLTFEALQDSDGEYTGDEKGTLVDVIMALRNVAGRYSDGDLEALVTNLTEYGYDGGIAASKFTDIVGHDERFNDYQDDVGRLVSKEILRQALAEAGFDGVIDQSVDLKFGSQRHIGKKMAGMGKKTTHYIAFEPEQVKSAVGNRGTFDPNDRNILHGFGSAGRWMRTPGGR